MQHICLIGNKSVQKVKMELEEGDLSLTKKIVRFYRELAVS